MLLVKIGYGLCNFQTVRMCLKISESTDFVKLETDCVHVYFFPMIIHNIVNLKVINMNRFILSYLPCLTQKIQFVKFLLCRIEGIRH